MFRENQPGPKQEAHPIQTFARDQDDWSKKLPSLTPVDYPGLPWWKGEVHLTISKFHVPKEQKH